VPEQFPFRWVTAPVVRPHQCACIPFIRGRHQKGFFDWGHDFPVVDGRVYVSVEAAQQMARFMGWTPKRSTDPLERELQAVKDAHAATLAELEQAKSELAAVQVLKNGSFRQQGAPGRPPKKTPA